PQVGQLAPGEAGLGHVGAKAIHEEEEAAGVRQGHGFQGNRVGETTKRTSDIRGPTATPRRQRLRRFLGAAPRRPLRLDYRRYRRQTRPVARTPSNDERRAASWRRGSAFSWIHRGAGI